MFAGPSVSILYRDFTCSLEKLNENIFVLFQNEMMGSIPSLINAIRMINSLSRYYNSSERMTSLFIKVKQMQLQIKKTVLFKANILAISSDAHQLHYIPLLHFTI